MAWFQLDPEKIAVRARAAGTPPRVPSPGESALRGGIGFMLVSMAGFLPWAASVHWFRGMGELTMYGACTVVFIGLGGIVLHRLLIGPTTLVRFYALFTLGFLAYAAAWVALWMWRPGDWTARGGLLAGAVAMGLIFTLAFDALRSLGPVVVVLFVPNLAGYLAGEWLAGLFGFHHQLPAVLAWGAGYGLGLGIGLGLALYLCQTKARRLLAAHAA